MAQLTHDERLEILQEFHKALKVGDDEQASAIIRKIPLAPPVAMATKEVFGVDFLKNLGFDLSEAEAEYGKNWLNQ